MPYSIPSALCYRCRSLIRLFQFVLLRFFSLSCNCSLTTDELSCMSTGAATVAPEQLQRRRRPAQTQPQHEHHRRSLAINYDNDAHTPPRIRYYYPTADAYVHFPSISTAPLNFFRASFSFHETCYSACTCRAILLAVNMLHVLNYMPVHI